MGVFEDRLHIKFQQSYILLYYFDKKGFHFPINLCSQNLDDFRKSKQNTYWLSQKAKQNTYWLSQKAKQLEDNSIKGILGLS